MPLLTKYTVEPSLCLAVLNKNTMTAQGTSILGVHMTRFQLGSCHPSFKNISVPYTNLSKKYIQLYTNFAKEFNQPYTNFVKKGSYSFVLYTKIVKIDTLPNTKIMKIDAIPYTKMKVNTHGMSLYPKYM